jgi:MFS family permease
MPRPPSAFQFLPPGVVPDATLLLWARGLRAFGDGYISLLLPYYPTLLGFGALEIGAIVAATLLGSGAMTLGIGLIAHRYGQRRLLGIAAAMMLATGIAFVLTPDFWPLLIIAGVGTINPSSSDANVFGPLEHAMLTRTVDARHRTALFARYTLAGAHIVRDGGCHPGERAAAASVTAVPRSLASAVGPMFAGWLLSLSTFGWSLVICGTLKIVYDLMLLALFRHVRPPEEATFIPKEKNP